jgi:hypothetical protein
MAAPVCEQPSADIQGTPPLAWSGGIQPLLTSWTTFPSDLLAFRFAISFTGSAQLSHPVDPILLQTLMRSPSEEPQCRPLMETLLPDEPTPVILRISEPLMPTHYVRSCIGFKATCHSITTYSHVDYILLQPGINHRPFDRVLSWAACAS